jgi:hypothetical protein
MQDLQGFCRTLKQVVLDVWTVLHGPERRAVRLALVIAFIDQGMASTAVVNYAPQVALTPALLIHSAITCICWCASSPP